MHADVTQACSSSGEDGMPTCPAKVVQTPHLKVFGHTQHRPDVGGRFGAHKDDAHAAEQWRQLGSGVSRLLLRAALLPLSRCLHQA